MINKQKQKVKTSAEMKHQRNENIPKHPKTKNVNENISETAAGIVGQEMRKIKRNSKK